MNQIISKQEIPENGFCPLISKALIVPKPSGVSITTPNGNMELMTVNALSPCLGGSCQLWDPEGNMCSQKTGAFSVFSIEKNFIDYKNQQEPATSGSELTGKTLDKISQAVEKLTYLVENLFKNIKQ